MTGTYSVLGHPIVPVPGFPVSPPMLIVNASLGVWYQATAGLIPVASLSGGAAEASALIGMANATAIG